MYPTVRVVPNTSTITVQTHVPNSACGSKHIYHHSADTCTQQCVWFQTHLPSQCRHMYPTARVVPNTSTITVQTHVPNSACGSKHIYHHSADTCTQQCVWFQTHLPSQCRHMYPTARVVPNTSTITVQTHVPNSACGSKHIYHHSADTCTQQRVWFQTHLPSQCRHTYPTARVVPNTSTITVQTHVPNSACGSKHIYHHSADTCTQQRVWFQTHLPSQCRHMYPTARVVPNTSTITVQTHVPNSACGSKHIYHHSADTCTQQRVWFQTHLPSQCRHMYPTVRVVPNAYLPSQCRHTYPTARVVPNTSTITVQTHVPNSACGSKHIYHHSADTRTQQCVWFQTHLPSQCSADTRTQQCVWFQTHLPSQCRHTYPTARVVPNTSTITVQTHVPNSACGSKHIYHHSADTRTQQRVWFQTCGSNTSTSSTITVQTHVPNSACGSKHIYHHSADTRTQQRVWFQTHLPSQYTCTQQCVWFQTHRTSSADMYPTARVVPNTSTITVQTQQQRVWFQTHLPSQCYIYHHSADTVPNSACGSKHIYHHSADTCTQQRVWFQTHLPSQCRHMYPTARVVPNTSTITVQTHVPNSACGSKHIYHHSADTCSQQRVWFQTHLPSQCRPSPVTVHWHGTMLSWHGPHTARGLRGKVSPLEYTFLRADTVVKQRQLWQWSEQE